MVATINIPLEKCIDGTNLKILKKKLVQLLFYFKNPNPVTCYLIQLNNIFYFLCLGTLCIYLKIIYNKFGMQLFSLL